MRTIVLTQANIINTKNNVMIYSFPNSVQFKDNYVAVSQVSMYYSWFNISEALSNNIFVYTWNATSYTITIPDGIYEISDLNRFLQYTFIAAGQYLINSSGANVYYLELVVSPTRYAIQINSYLFPLALPAGFTAPTNFIGFSANTFNPRITATASFNKIIGYDAGFQTDLNFNNTAPNPTAVGGVKNITTGTISYLSSFAPTVQPNSNILISMSNIDNAYASPTGILYSIVPNVAAGSLISEKPPQLVFNRMIDGTYNELRLTFLGTNLSPIILNDPAITIMLVIKDVHEN